MSTGPEIGTLAAITRAQNTSRIKTSLFYAVLLILLWWQTRWPSLHWGLSMLLLAQLGSALLLLWRNMRLLPSEPGGEWIANQLRWETRLHVFENVTRAAGFLLLAWGFWQATRNVSVALLLGVIYPGFMYWGVARKNYARSMARFRTTAADV
jgi:hypothetical protein